MWLVWCSSLWLEISWLSGQPLTIINRFYFFWHHQLWKYYRRVALKPFPEELQYIMIHPISRQFRLLTLLLSRIPFPSLSEILLLGVPVVNRFVQFIEHPYCKICDCCACSSSIWGWLPRWLNVVHSAFIFFSAILEIRHFQFYVFFKFTVQPYYYVLPSYSAWKLSQNAHFGGSALDRSWISTRSHEQLYLH